MHASNLNQIIEVLSRDSFGQKYKNLNKAICQMVEEFGLVSFLTLAIEDKESVQSVIMAVDNAIGYVPKEAEFNGHSILEAAHRFQAWGQYNREIGERYLKHNYADGDLVQDVKFNIEDSNI